MNKHNTFRRDLPEYYDTMYQDGFEPWEILAAARKTMWKAAEARRQEAEPPEEYTVNIKSEVKVK